MSGRGTVYSFVRAHAPVLPAFSDKAPFYVVLVELEEDRRIRMVGNLLGAVEKLAIGDAVEVAFEDVGPEDALPQWRLR
jgi:uncharacterized OB-fold protein